MYPTNSTMYVPAEESLLPQLSSEPLNSELLNNVLFFAQDNYVDYENHEKPEINEAPELHEDQVQGDEQEECVEEVGRNCRIDVASKHETVRLYQELLELKNWFEDYGREGVLFPNSIINGFAPLSRAA